MDVRQIIAQAANRYGVDPNAMTAIAHIESRLNPAAQNPRSSAGGLFQQIDSNARQYGVTDRFDPVQSAEGAARFARENTVTLRRVLGREPTAGELYLAHQQGPGGATRLLRDPNARAVDVVGAAAVRLNGGNDSMTAGEFANLWINKANNALNELSGGGATQLQGGAGTTQLSGQQATDTFTPTPQQTAGAYQAYINGQMSPEAAAAYQADVAAGLMPLPDGVTMPAPQSAAQAPAAPPLPDIAANAEVVAEVYRRYVNGELSTEAAQEYARDVQAGRMGLPPDVPQLSGDPMTPSAFDAPAFAQPDTRFAPDLTRQYAAESGGNLAMQAAAGLTGSGPSPTGAIFPNAPGVLRGAGDAGLAVLGGLGAAGGAIAGAVGDVAEMAGVPRAPQLARDLAAIPEALVGSPVTLGQSVARQAVRSAPDAPRTAMPVAVPRTEPPITREIPAPRQLNEAETNEMRSLIARAANNNTQARNQLAEMAKVDPEAQAAAARLGIEAPVDVFATNAGVTQAAGIVRAVRGSDASVEWEDTFTAAQRRANELIETEGGTTDLSAISARVQDDLTGSINTLRADAGVIYNEIRDAIPTGTRLAPDASTRALNGILEDLGGPESLTGPVKGLFDAVTSDQGMTYGRLMQERGQIGRAIASNQGPYADADSRTLGQLYAALGEDQMNFVRTEVGEDAAARLQQANGLWSSAKDLEASLIAGFGRDQQGSIANTLRTAITNASRGDAGRLNRILNVVPENLQRETLLTGLADLSQARSGQGGFSFAQYSKTYRGLRDNSEIYARVAPILGDQTADLMRDLYEVSIRMDRASQNVPRTGQSNQALIADGLISNVLNSSMGRAARGMVAGVGASAAAGPALGSLAAIGASSGKLGRNRAEAVSRLFRDPAFQKLAEEAAARGQPSAQTINAASSSIAFRRWAGINGIESPDAWIIETIARLSAQAPQGETTGTQQ